jgi:hypothetical protein
MKQSGTTMVPFLADSSGNLLVNIASGSVQAVTDNNSVFTPSTTQGLALAGAFNDSAGALTSGNMGLVRVTANRQLRVVVDAQTNNGATKYRLLSAASTNATNVKTSGGQISSLYVGNAAASARFLKFYDSATAPTAGSGTPALTLMIPAQDKLEMPNCNIPFTSGIGFTTTELYTDTDTTAVAAGDLTINFVYA